MKIINKQRSPASSYFITLYFILLSALFSNTISLRSSLNVRDQVLHPYKTTGKITVICILIFKLL
jgi:hypothetical protein